MKTTDAPALERGQHVNIRISSMTPTGSGISKDFGRPIFVDRVAPGDLVEVELFDVRRDFAKAKVINLIESSPVRDTPPCPVFNVCGGCQWQHMTYEGQLAAKTDIMKQAVEHIGRQDPNIVRDTIGCSEPLHYRNKVQFPVKNPQKSTRILAGYYKPDSHELVNIKFCPIQPEPLDRMLNTVKYACEKNGIWAYDEKTKKGSLRHINARYSFARNQIVVTLVVNMRSRNEEEFARSPLGERLRQTASDIIHEVDEIVGVCVNLNAEEGNKILGSMTFPLLGKDYIVETLKTSRDNYPDLLRNGIEFRLSPTSFFQVNTVQAVRLLEVVFDEARNLLHGIEKPVIIDAFAGVGTMALWLSPLAHKVIAIEDHETAVTDGKLNAELNGIHNVEFIHGTVETVLPHLLAQGIKPDLIIMDPPRKGLTRETVNAVLDFELPAAIYVSCNPSTLARDLALLDQGKQDEPNTPLSGYKTKQIQPVDLFPQTYHVESVTTLERRAHDGSVRDLEKA